MGLEAEAFQGGSASAAGWVDPTQRDEDEPAAWLQAQGSPASRAVDFAL